MKFLTYVEHVRQDGDRLAAVATGSLSEAVPSCPGWTVRDVVSHVGEVYEHKIACTELGHAPDPWPPAWPTDRDPIEWMADAQARLLEMFRERGPEAPSATWWPPDQTVGFWARRMANETAVHRVDVELAVGTATPVDAELAVDGVDEILVVMLAGDWSEDPSDRPTARVEISTGGHHWIVTLEPEAVSIAERDGAAEAALGGDPSDVLLWLWGRAPDERVVRSGDDDALRLLRSRLVLATQ
jgi:uncharacterized protein (TIGR03083 family)